MAIRIDNKPSLSVLVTCHDRRDYLLGAVKSVIEQTVDRSVYEIIVSKNFKDPQIDRFLIANGCKLIYDEKSGIGMRLAGLVEASSSDLLVFLEDDDRFEKEKLEYVLDVFESPEVNYFHNGYRIVDYKNTLLSTNEVNYCRDLSIYSTSTTSFGVIRKLFIQNAFFSMSNISIRKSLILSSLDTMKKITVGPDIFMFLMASQSTGTLAVSCFPLTEWMLHDSTSVAAGGKVKFLVKRRLFWSQVISDLENCSSIISNVNSRKLLKCLYSEAVTHNFILGQLKAHKLVMIYDTAKGFVFLRTKRALLVFLLSLGGSISQKISLTIYSAFLLRKSPKS